MKVIVRPATESDIPALYVLAKELAMEQVAIMKQQSGGIEPEFHLTEDALKSALFSPISICTAFVAVHDDQFMRQHERGTIIGYTLSYPRPSSFHGDTLTWLEDIYVKKTYRTKEQHLASGALEVGRHLMINLMSHARSQGSVRVEARVIKTDKNAKEFFNKFADVERKRVNLFESTYTSVRIELHGNTVETKFPHNITAMPAQIVHAETLFYFIKSHARESNPRNPPQFYNTLAKTKEHLRVEVSERMFKYVVAYHKLYRRPIGYILNHNAFSTWLGKQFYWIQDLHVESLNQKREVGGALVRSLNNIAIDNGVPRIEVRFPSWDDRARDFWSYMFKELGSGEFDDSWSFFRIPLTSPAMKSRQL